MIKIAIVEDEAMYAKQLEEFLHQYEAENHEAFDICCVLSLLQMMHGCIAHPLQN